MTKNTTLTPTSHYPKLLSYMASHTNVLFCSHFPPFFSSPTIEHEREHLSSVPVYDNYGGRQRRTSAWRPEVWKASGGGLFMSASPPATPALNPPGCAMGSFLILHSRIRYLWLGKFGCLMSMFICLYCVGSCLLRVRWPPPFSPFFLFLLSSSGCASALRLSYFIRCFS